MKHKLCYWGALVTLVLLCLPVTAWAVDSPVGVAYRGHIQDRGDYPLDGSWVDSPEIIGTVGESKRIEGFEIKLTGDVPADLQNGMELRYNVHVQNRGWLYDEDDCSDWPKDGAYAGTRGDSLRIEAVKIVLTDSAGQPLSGYSVQYRGHVQNVGDLPADETQWLVDGEQLGTVGSSLRLEALLVQVVKTAVDPAETVVYDAAGSYGPTTGSDTLAGDVTVAADGVTLNNLVIQGNLTISEAVGDGNVTLNNVTVVGDTLIRGGGVNSIHLNGGQYSRIVMEKTASGAVRIVATGVDGLDVVVAEDASGETIILEGAFASVTVNAPNMVVTTQGNTTTIGMMTVGVDGAGTTLNLASGTTVTDLVLDGKAAVKGQGTVTRADVNADGVVFDKKPGAYTVEPGVVIPPVFPADGGSGGGGPTTIPVSAVSLDKTAIALAVNVTDSLTATVAPATATNKALSWSSSDDTIATVDSSGTVTAVKEGAATITVTSQDGHKSATCAVTVKDLKQTIAGVTVPFAGATPVTAITTTSQYGGTVSWQKKVGSGWTDLAGATFDGTSTYRATIALTINAPYSTADIPANFFGVAGATATNEAGSLVVTAEFLPTHQYKITALGVITAYSGPGGAVAVPATVNNITVTGIGIEAFKNQTTITAITLPTTVTTIEEAAFFGCGGLTAVTFTAPAQLQKIGAKAFQDCAALTGIAIPDAVTSIKVAAFKGCTKLAIVTISANAQLESIESEAFSNCSALTAINIPQLVTSLGDRAFQACGVLDTVTIAGNLTVIGTYTFSGCQALTAITLPESITSIGYEAFSYCEKLTSIAIPQKVTALGAYAFDNCLELKTVTFTGTPTLTTIGQRAFNHCNKLTEIEIPKTVTALGAYAFDNCTELSTVTFTGTPMLQTIGHYAFNGCNKLTEIEIPKTVTTLRDYAFKNCSALSTITFRGPTPTLGSEAIAAGTTIRHYGNFSGYDDWAGMVPVHILAPPLVTDLQITNYGPGVAAVTVNWSTVTGATGYDVFVSEVPGTYGAATISVAGDVTTADISGLDSSKNCYFIVKARDAYGESISSDEKFTDFTIPVAGVNLTPATLNLVYGDTASLTATVAPANATNPGISWSSSNPAVASVDQIGTVTASGAGTAVITASATADNTKTATTTVTVQGRLSIHDFKAVAGLEAGNYVVMLLEGDTFISGNNDFDINAGTTGLALSYTGPSDQHHRVFNLTNIAKAGTLTLQATGLTSGVNSSTDSLTVTAVTLDKETADLSLGGNLNLLATVLPTDAPDQTLSWSSGTTSVATVDPNGKVTGVAQGTAVITAQTASGSQDTCTVTVLPFTASGASGLTITGYTGDETAVTIPATLDGKPVVAIGDKAFLNKIALSVVSIPATVTRIGFMAFENCTNLATVNFASESQLTTIETAAFSSCLLLKNIVLPDTVKAIKDSAFAWCFALESINLPAGLVTLEPRAFSFCQQLTAVTIPESITTIPSGAFHGCFNLTSVTLPTTLTSIEANAFRNCSKLVAITIPDQVAMIGATAFSFGTETPPAARTFTFMGNAPALETDAIKEADETTTITIRRKADSTGFGGLPWSGYTTVYL